MDTELKAARDVWSRLCEVDSVVVKVIVDNETDGLSSACPCCDNSMLPTTTTPYKSEFTAAVESVASGKRPCMDFRQSLLAGHGLSLLVEARASNGRVARVLFDGGPQEELWTTNARQLGLDMAGVGAAVLSHWHVDHSVGLRSVARAASEARRHPSAESRTSAPFVFDVHPKRPLKRGLMLGPQAKTIVPFNEDPTFEELGSLPGCRVEQRAEPHTLLDDLFFVSGTIPRVTAFETGQAGHGTEWPDSGWQLDPHIMEERYLAVKVKGKGAVVFSGCSHAGIVNVVTHVKNVSEGPVFGVMGGLHLAGRAMEPRIDETVTALRELDPHLILAGHCTGWRAKAALRAALPDRFQPVSVGGTYSFFSEQLPPPPE